METLALKFQNELIAKMDRAKKECNYNSTRFNQMITQYGGVETAKRLIGNSLRTRRPSDGYTNLLLAGRTDLTMEDSICDPQYAELFTEEEISLCKEFLGRNS